MIPIDINAKDNALTNAKLTALYEDNTVEFLKVWSEAFGELPPCRMNDFGIIDIHRYNTANGILFIGRETNGWSDEDYKSGCLFRNWMRDISQNGLEDRGHIKKHPNMWYNIGRWVMLLTEPGRPITDIADAKEEAISAIGNIAFTNVNKVRGKNTSRKEYYQLAQDPFVKSLLQKEIEIIKPKIIVACGTARPMFPLPESFSGELYIMPHPGARKNKTDMLVELNKQIRSQRRGK